MALGITQAQGQRAAEPQSYTEAFYSAGPLRIQAYLYQPAGNGPFPLVIYNHGSRANRERESWPFSHDQPVDRTIRRMRGRTSLSDRRS